MNAIWITWEHQRRNVSMAQLLEVDYHEMQHSGWAPIRYSILFFKTMLLLSRKRPDIVFYQNPSIILALTTSLYKIFTLFKVTIVGDYHNAGVHPPFGKSFIKPLSRFSDLILVSNDSLVDTVTAWGCSSIAFPDPIPSIMPPTFIQGNLANQRKKMLFICSWADDEPINEVLTAGHQLDDIDLFITGKPKLDAYPLAKSPAENTTLTGFLPERKFEELVYQCDIIMDLTTRDNCMVCGAYEGIAAEKPIILSDNQASRDYFDLSLIHI